jgi:hypothetical protein
VEWGGFSLTYDRTTGRLLHAEDLENPEESIIYQYADGPHPGAPESKFELVERPTAPEPPRGGGAGGRTKGQRSVNAARQYAIDLGSYEVERYLWQQNCLAAFSQKYGEYRQQTISGIKKTVAMQAGVVTGVATVADMVPTLNASGIPRIVKGAAVLYGAAGYLLAPDIASWAMLDLNFSIVANPPCR